MSVLDHPDRPTLIELVALTVGLGPSLYDVATGQLREMVPCFLVTPVPFASAAYGGILILLAGWLQRWLKQPPSGDAPVRELVDAFIVLPCSLLSAPYWFRFYTAKDCAWNAQVLSGLRRQLSGLPEPALRQYEKLFREHAEKRQLLEITWWQCRVMRLELRRALNVALATTIGR